MPHTDLQWWIDHVFGSQEGFEQALRYAEDALNERGMTAEQIGEYLGVATPPANGD